MGCLDLSVKKRFTLSPSLLCMILLVSVLSFTAYGQIEHAVNKPLEVTILVKNPTGNSLIYDVHLYVNDTLVASKQVAAPPRSSVNASLTWTPDRAGTYELKVVVRSGGEVVEEKTYLVKVIGQPDLTVKSISISPESYGPGDIITVMVVVANKGTAPSQATEISLLFGSEELSRQEIPSLDPGESLTINFTYKVPQKFTGGNLTIDLDPDNLVSEANESNSFGVEITPITEISTERTVQKTASETYSTPRYTTTSEEITEGTSTQISTSTTAGYIGTQGAPSKAQGFPLIYLAPVLIGIALAGAYLTGFGRKGVSGGEAPSTPTSPSTTPVAPVPAKSPCCLDWEFRKGGGIEIFAPEELMVPYGGILPLWACATDMDSVMVRCITCASSELEASSTKIVPIPDTLKYRWEIVAGRGSLISAADELELFASGSAASISHQLGSVEGYWPYRSQAFADGPSVIYAAPQPPECNMTAEKGSQRMERRKRVEEVVTLKLTVYDLQGKVEQIDDRGKEGRGVTKIIKIRVADEDLLREGKSVRTDASQRISLRDRMRHHYMEELLKVSGEKELRRLVDEWWNGIVKKAQADKDLAEKKAEIGRGISTLVYRLRSFREIENLMSMGSYELAERLSYGGEVTITGRRIEPLEPPIEESMNSIRDLAAKLRKKCEELKASRKLLSEMESDLEGKWQEVISKLKKIESRGEACDLAVKWLLNGPIVGEVISPARESPDPEKQSRSDPIKVRTVPVIEVTREEGEELGEKEERGVEVYPAMTLLPGQSVPFRAMGKDVDLLRMECRGFSKEVPLNDLLFYRWRARWLDEPLIAWEDLAELPQISGSIKRISALLKGMEDLLGILNDIEKDGKVTDDIRRKLKELYRKYEDVEWFREILMKYTALDVLKEVDMDTLIDRSTLESDEALLLQASPMLSRMKKHLEEIRKTLKSLARSLMELDPTGKFLGNGGETVIFRAPHARGFMELTCDIEDSGMQAIDGSISKVRYIEVTGNPPWLSFLHELNMAEDDLAELKKTLDSHSWTRIDNFWEMLDYICHKSGLKGLRSHIIYNFEGYRPLFSALLEPSERDDLRELVEGRKRDVIYRILKDLSLRDSMALLLRLYKLLLEEKYVLNITMSWREGILWALFWVSFMFPGLPDLLGEIIWGAGNVVSLGLNLMGMEPSTHEGLPENLVIFEGARRMSGAVKKISSAKDDLDRSTADLLNSLLEEYSKASHEDRRNLVRKMMMEISLSVLRYLVLYFQGCALTNLFDNPKCDRERKTAKLSSNEAFKELQSAVENTLRRIENEDIRYGDIDSLSYDLANKSCNLAERYANGPGMIQVLEELLERSLEADLFLLSL